MDNKDFSQNMDLIPFSISEHCLETYLVSISSRSRIIYWIIIAMIIVSLILLPVIKVDVSIQARGYFQSDIEKQIIFSPAQGKAIYISVRTGMKVKRGDTLLIVDTLSGITQYASLQQKINENNASIKDLEKLTVNDLRFDSLDKPRLFTPRYRAEFENFQSRCIIQEEKYQKKRTEHDRNELLYHQELIPKTEFENSQFLLKSERNILDQLQSDQGSLWQNDLTLRKNESINLLAELRGCMDLIREHIVTAPADGEIIQSSDIQVGSNVSSGQKIAEISPGGTLLATCFVKTGDAGFIHEKQNVKIQVDAFNHNEWGMINGEIIEISDDMLVENGSVAYFRVRCKPEKTYLSLKNGYRAEIKKGMSLSTRIFIIRRSLFHLLFDKADKWFNPYTYIKE